MYLFVLLKRTSLVAPRDFLYFRCLGRGAFEMLRFAIITLQTGSKAAGQSNSVDLTVSKWSLLYGFHLHGIACHAFDCLPLFMIYALSLGLQNRALS